MTTTELTPRVVVLSSTSRAALDRTRQRLAEHLARQPIALSDIAVTLADGREALPVRAAIVVATEEELIEKLRSGDTDHASTIAHRTNRTAVYSSAPSDDEWGIRIEAGLAAAGVLREESEHTGNRVVRLRIDPERTTVEILIDEKPSLSVRGSVDTVLAECLARLWCLGAAVDPVCDVEGVRRHLPAPACQRPDDEVSADLGDDGIDRRPLTFLQQRLLFHDIIRKSSTSEHHVAAGWAFTQPVDAELLLARCAELAERNPEPRTFFRQEPAGWRSCVRSEVLLRMETVASTAESTNEDLLRSIAAEPLELVDAEPFRAVLNTTPSGASLLVFVTHRAVTDGQNLVRLIEAACAEHGGSVVGPIGMR